jgi:uncharacterized membrane protein YeiH
VTAGRIVAGLIVIAALALVFAPIWRSGEHLSTLVHHLAHGAVLIGGSALGLALATPQRQAAERTGWLIPAAGAAIVVMVLMWPTLYEYTESRPVLHVLDHIGIGLFGFTAAYAGQRYRAGVGWILSVVVLLMAITAAGGFGDLIRGSYPQ